MWGVSKGNAASRRGSCAARRSGRRAWLLALLSGGLPELASAQPAPIQLAVVVGPETRLTNISMADLQRVFSSEVVTANDGTRLLPINHPPRTADRVAFD